MNAAGQVRALGPGFFGCLQFRRQTSDSEEQLSIEPLQGDDRFMFLMLDLQREGPQQVDELESWLIDAFGFLRTRVADLLSTSINQTGG